MRPIRLVLRGFGTFRDHTEIDFSEADLFALVGPTGAGKSTIIDAIVFALYGSVSRYRNTKLVAPVISQLANEARVQLDFTMADTPYTAVRVVRRTASGATTKHARLEQGDDVLAANARELDDAVEQLVGLNFDQFTKTVVLPQGDFAQFLTDTGKDRQALLRRLLGVERYRTMASAARERAKIADATRQALTEQLDASDRAGQVQVLATRRSALAELGEELELEVRKRSVALDEHAEAIERIDVLEKQLELLDSIHVPDNVAAAADEIAAANTELEELQQQATEAATILGHAQQRAEAAGPLDSARKLVESHDQLADIDTRLDTAQRDATSARGELERTESVHESARTELSEAEGDRDRGRVRAGAIGLRHVLTTGDRCPVCDQIVHVVPGHDPDVELASLEERCEQLAAAVARTAAERDAAKSATASAVALFAVLDESRVSLTTIVGDSNGADARAGFAEATEATDALAAAQQLGSAVIARVQDTTGRVRDLTEGAAERQRVFTALRDDVSALGPPVPAGSSLFADWSALLHWADSEARARRVVLTEQTTIRSSAADRAEKHAAVLVDRCTPFLDSEPLPDDLTTWHATLLARIDEQLIAAQAAQKEHADFARRIEALDEEHIVASTMGQLLSATGFEQWLMEDSMRSLAELASVRLLELSSGAFSLVIDGADFSICDHHNADEIRSPRSLSGGETFLASLALALALADSITELASGQSPVVESMFLDEGFGTLDPETLDVVASTIEELGTSGRMIGIVTHLADLADRMPVRFVVHGASGSSTVSREVS